MAACGDGGATPSDGANPDTATDAAATDAATTDAPTTDAPTCTPPTDRPFVRATDNPQLRAGTRIGADVDVTIADPDVHWTGTGWRAYVMAARGASFSAPLTQTIRAVDGSADGTTWTLRDPPVLSAASEPTAWDHANTETPSVVVNPAAPPARRYLMLYAGANGTQPGQSFPSYAIGAAFSADGLSFTRVPASESPHGAAGLVLTGGDVYPGAAQSLVADPEVAYRDGVYHVWFSSFACDAGCTTVEAFGVAHATSTDGVHWTPDATSPVRSLLRDPALRTSGGQQPSVVWDDAHCRWELWLTSDAAGENDAQPIEFNNSMGAWHATSADGAAWTIDYGGARDLTWTATEPGEPLGLLTGADVAGRGADRLMLYVGFDDQQVPSGFFLPDRTETGFRPGVMALGVATRSE